MSARPIDTLIVEANNILASGRELHVYALGIWMTASSMTLLADNDQLVIIKRTPDGFVFVLREEDVRSVMATG